MPPSDDPEVNVPRAADRSWILMSRIIVIVEFELKPEHRSQFIELIKGHAQRSRA